jgi:hypothetical protein
MFQRLESICIALLATITFVHIGFDWWWLLVLFLAFDISMIGYAFSKTIGAISYNVGHSYIVPTLFLAMYVLTDQRVWVFIGLLWVFHIAVDRALGYGLKEKSGFEHTHLGAIGKSNSQKR